jgi:signal transduction histidine kinase
MTGRFLTALALIFIGFYGYGQTIPPAYEIKNDTLWQQDIGDSMVLFIEDTEGKMTIENAKLALQQGKMKPWKNEYNKAGLNVGKYWFYFRLSNKTGKNIESGFDAFSNVADYHVTRPTGKKEVYTTGDYVSWKKKKEFRFSNIVSFQMSAGETVDVFYHATLTNSRFANQMRLTLAHPDRYARKWLIDNEPVFVRIEQQQIALYSGIFLSAALIYFVFFFLVGEKVFLYFAFFLLFLFIGGSPFLTKLERYYPPAIFIGQAMGVTSFVFFFHFIRQYLNTKTHLPRWDKFLVAFSFIFLITGVVNVIVEHPQDELFFASLAIFVIVLIATFFLLKKQQQTEKKFLLYAVLPFFLVFPLLTILATLFFLSGDKSFFLNNKFINWLGNSLSSLVDLTFVWMIISFSRLLFRRFTEQRQKISEQEKEKEQILIEQEQEKLRLIEKQKEDLENQVTERTAELKKSLEDLKSTQTQLIQSEKMASLGEMTAGIAHEIQNPLNFVNNFAEVNNEITAEIKTELEKWIPEDKRDELNALLDDLAGNQEKIRFHGKRADSIVKNMLLHSRRGGTQREPVNLNALVDEYTRLSYHGLRARDKTFNSDFNIQLDPAITSVDLLQQDFGRVILNLLNNAFYAVHDKSKSAGNEYKPCVEVNTSLANDTVRIEVNDNGNGIPEKIKDKIFQPFFTTKPAGEGTGLGLSLSYDIITKGHGGNMKVESKEGEGTSFIIELPI